MSATAVPTIDISALVDPSGDPAERAAVGVRVGAACEEFGFLQIVGHGVDATLRRRLLQVAEQFFALDESVKAEISMRRGGSAWRGWFPVGAELTSGRPDNKEGIYFGTELGDDDPKVLARTPLHGANLFPERPAEMGEVVLAWMHQVTATGRAVLSAIAMSLGLEPSWFDRWCADPTVLFRMFHYPPATDGRWGVAEHTDYGLLTLLVQDDTGGLQVRVDDDWIDVAPHPDAIVVNLGDMLERLSDGRFRSTTHRVAGPERDRYSFPLFLDPAWDARVEPLPGADARRPAETGRARWDGEDLFAVDGVYGDYLLERVSRVFPGLFDEVVGPIRGERSESRRLSPRRR